MVNNMIFQIIKVLHSMGFTNLTDSQIDRLTTCNRYKRFANRKDHLANSFAPIVILLFLVGSAPVMSIGGFASKAANRLSYAPCSASASVIYTLLIDNPDPIRTIQQNQVDTLVLEFLSSTKPGSHVNVVRLTDNIERPVNVLFDGCDPGGIDDYSIWFNTPSEIIAHRNKVYANPLQQALMDAQKPYPQAKTPLVEGLAAVGAIVNGEQDKRFSDQTKQLLIISDLLQNSEISAYEYNFPDVESKHYLDSHLANLQGVNVMIGIIDRPKYRNKQLWQSLEWFDTYLKNSRVENTKIIRIK